MPSLSTAIPPWTYPILSEYHSFFLRRSIAPSSHLQQLLASYPSKLWVTPTILFEGPFSNLAHLFYTMIFLPNTWNFFFTCSLSYFVITFFFFACMMYLYYNLIFLQTIIHWLLSIKSFPILAVLLSFFSRDFPWNSVHSPLWITCLLSLLESCNFSSLIFLTKCLYLCVIFVLLQCIYKSFHKKWYVGS